MGADGSALQEPRGVTPISAWPWPCGCRASRASAGAMTGQDQIQPSAGLEPGILPLPAEVQHSARG